MLPKSRVGLVGCSVMQFLMRLVLLELKTGHWGAPQLVRAAGASVGESWLVPVARHACRGTNSTEKSP